MKLPFVRTIAAVTLLAAAQDGNDCGYFGSCSGGEFGGGMSVFGFGGFRR